MVIMVLVVAALMVMTPMSAQMLDAAAVGGLALAFGNVGVAGARRRIGSAGKRGFLGSAGGHGTAGHPAARE